MFGFFRKKKRPDREIGKLIEIADILSRNNPAVHASMVHCLNNTVAYSMQYAERYAQRGIDIAHCDRENLCWIALADEMENAGDLVGVDTACEAEDLCWSLSQMNLVKDMGLAIPEPETEELYCWLVEFQEFFQAHGLVLCEFCMDSDDYHLILVPTGSYETVLQLAQLAGQKITEVDGY